MNLADKYRILKRIGEQKHRKFNDVFLVEHKATGEHAILKTLTKTADNIHLQEYLRNEATFNFDRTGLPKTLDFYESENELLLVRSYQPGIPLNVFIRSIRKKDKPAFLFQLLTGLAPIFEELHKQHIVHLDMKPGNLLINGQVNHFRVALIDFGMAARMTDLPHRKTLFPLGYAAPELVLNRLQLVDWRTDQFALGITFWQCFTGKLPLLNAHPGITTNLQLTHPLPEDTTISAPYFRILKKMCHKHVFAKPPNLLPATELDALLSDAINERYASLDEIIEEWDNALQAKKRFLFWKK